MVQDDDSLGITELVDEFDYDYMLPSGGDQALTILGRYTPQSK